MIGNVAISINNQNNQRGKQIFSTVSNSNETSSSGKSHSSIDDESEEDITPKVQHYGRRENVINRGAIVKKLAMSHGAGLSSDQEPSNTNKNGLHRSVLGHPQSSQTLVNGSSGDESEQYNFGNKKGSTAALSKVSPFRGSMQVHPSHMGSITSDSRKSPNIHQSKYQKDHSSTNQIQVEYETQMDKIVEEVEGTSQGRTQRSLLEQQKSKKTPMQKQGQNLYEFLETDGNHEVDENGNKINSNGQNMQNFGDEYENNQQNNSQMNVTGGGRVKKSETKMGLEKSSKKKNKIEFTTEYIDYLNLVYEQGKSNKNIEEGVEQLPKTCKESCMHLLTCGCLRKNKTGEEEDDDWSVILTPVFSSGESDDECREQFISLNEVDQNQRIHDLWRRLIIKANGGAKIVRRFAELSEDITMFGASRKIDLDIDEEIIPLPFILMPENYIKMFWNFVIMFLLLYTATFVPYRTAFIDDVSEELADFEWCVDALFMFDLIINFISAYEDRDKNIEVRMKFIALNYIKSWFFLDMAACIPFQLLESDTNAAPSYTADSGQTVTAGPVVKKSNSGKINKLIRLARLPRLYRLLRILRLFKIVGLLSQNASFKKLQEAMKVNAGIQRMVLVGLGVLFMVHLMACLWFLVAKLNDFDDQCWVVNSGILDKSGPYQYLTSVYWALQTLTTVGYGDIHAYSVHEKIAALMWMIIGVGFYSFTIGNLSSIINTIDVKAAHLQQKLNILTEFAKRTKLPDDVQNRIKRFLENNHNEHLSLFDQKQLLSEIPASLRAEVVSHTHGEIIKNIKFFNDKDPHFLFSVLPILKPMKVYRKDILYNQGDYAEEVFFILKGRVKMYYDVNEGQDGNIINVPFNLYVEGSYFGDSEIFVSEDRNARDSTAIAETECQLLVITRKELLDILRRFKKLTVEMREVAIERKKHHERAIRQVIERHRQRMASAGDQHLSTQGMQGKKDQELENKKIIFNKYVKGKGSKQGKENAKLELVQLFEQEEKTKYGGAKNSNTMNSGMTVGLVKADSITNGQPQISARNTVDQIAQQDLESKQGVTAALGSGNRLTSRNPFNLKIQIPQNQFSSNMTNDKKDQTPTKDPYQIKLVQTELIQEEDQEKNQLKIPTLNVNSENNQHQQYPAQINIGNFSARHSHPAQEQAPGNNNNTLKQQTKNNGLKNKQPSSTMLISGPTGDNRVATSAPQDQQTLGQDKQDKPKTQIGGGPTKTSSKRDSLMTKVPDSSQNSHRQMQDADKESQTNSSSENSGSSNSSSSSMSDDDDDEDDDGEYRVNDKSEKVKLKKAAMAGSIISDNMSDDSHWIQNEQIFQNFQENMALIAGNSFEILQLYEMISKDYAKINQSIAEMEQHNEQVEDRSRQLENKLERIVKLL